jgi:hypothetical protein
MAEGMFARGRRASGMDLVLRPALRFLKFYVLKRGCLHGAPGFLLACFAVHHVRLKYAKLLVLQRERDAARSAGDAVRSEAAPQPASRRTG